MRNHEWVNGKLLQTNKKYSHLKLKQKEKIYQWMYDSYRKAPDRTMTCSAIFWVDTGENIKDNQGTE